MYFGHIYQLNSEPGRGRRAVLEPGGRMAGTVGAARRGAAGASSW